MTVDAMSAEAVRPLRQAVLRPHQAPGELVFDGDDDPLALHVGSRVDDRLVGVATIAPGGHPVEPRPGDWRLRGMATLPEVRGSGCGTALLAACLEHARARGGRRVWCNARTGARGFYARHGFRDDGEVFDLPDIGPHIRMVRSL